jgi:hypothetical protein
MEMYREFQVDISELKRLKGIRIEATDSAQPFLVFTYKKGKMRERVLALVSWSVVPALNAICGFVFLCGSGAHYSSALVAESLQNRNGTSLRLLI